MKDQGALFFSFETPKQPVRSGQRKRNERVQKGQKMLRQPDKIVVREAVYKSTNRAVHAKSHPA